MKINSLILVAVLTALIFSGCTKKLLDYNGASSGSAPSTAPTAESANEPGGILPGGGTGSKEIDKKTQDDMADALDKAKEHAKVAEDVEIPIVKDSPEYKARLELADKYGNAKKQRDGHAEFALLGQELQQLLRPRMEEQNWSTGVSSPWIRAYTVAMSGNDAKITFEYASSKGFEYRMVETLSFATEDGKLVISSIG